MRARATRAALLAALLGTGSIAAAGCFPGAPPAHTLCSSVQPPGPNAKVALVAQGGTHPDVVRFDADTQEKVQAKVEQLNQTGHVLAVGPDQPLHAQVVNPGNNPDYAANQTDFQANGVDFPAAWNSTPSLDGSTVRVAVVDTGVQADHPDLAGNVTSGNDLVFGNGPSNFARIDGNGHGTHVAGTIAAVDNFIGVVGGAPRSTIVPVRVLDCNGSGFTSTVAQRIAWAADPNGGAAKVINLSLGGDQPDNVLAADIQNATANGVVVVAAAGNCGNGGTNCPLGANTPEYPGAYAGSPGFSGLIAVGALDSSTAITTSPDGVLTQTTTTIAAPVEAPFSSADIGFTITDTLNGIPPNTTITGVTSAATATISHAATSTVTNDMFSLAFAHKASFSNNNNYVTVSAPGVNIKSTVPFSGPRSSPSGYAFLSGTSMATPHVAAVAALIFNRCGLTEPAASVRAKIVNGAKPLPASSGFFNPAVGLVRADAVVSGSC